MPKTTSKCPGPMKITLVLKEKRPGEEVEQEEEGGMGKAGIINEMNNNLILQVQCWNETGRCPGG